MPSLSSPGWPPADVSPTCSPVNSNKNKDMNWTHPDCSTVSCVQLDSPDMDVRVPPLGEYFAIAVVVSTADTFTAGGAPDVGLHNTWATSFLVTSYQLSIEGMTGLTGSEHWLQQQSTCRVKCSLEASKWIQVHKHSYSHWRPHWWSQRPATRTDVFMLHYEINETFYIYLLTTYIKVLVLLEPPTSNLSGGEAKHRPWKREARQLLLMRRPVFTLWWFYTTDNKNKFPWM